MWIMSLPLPQDASTAAPDDATQSPLHGTSITNSRTNSKQNGSQAGDSADLTADRKDQHSAQEMASKAERKISKKELKALQKTEKRNQRRQRKLQKQRGELGTEPDASSDGEDSGMLGPELNNILMFCSNVSKWHRLRLFAAVMHIQMSFGFDDASEPACMLVI
jgi:hypothetical protein